MWPPHMLSITETRFQTVVAPIGQEEAKISGGGIKDSRQYNTFFKPWKILEHTDTDAYT